MATNAGNVARLYDTIVDYEDTRLATHPMERELTLRAIRESLGPGPKRVADIGGGPGRIAFPLADEGYLVDLIDLSPGLIKLAQKEQNIRKATEPNKPVLQRINVGNALATHNLPEAAYDAVLLLGPLYHLVAEEERAQAIENALLLTKPGGLLFVAFISVAAHLRDIAVRDPKRLVEEKDFYDRYLQHGNYVKYNNDMGIEVQSHHTSAADVKCFLSRHFQDKLALVSLRSTEGILGGGLDSKLQDAGPDVLQAWTDLMWEKYSQQDEFLGCADHLLAVLSKNRQRHNNKSG